MAARFNRCVCYGLCLSCGFLCVFGTGFAFVTIAATIRIEKAHVMDEQNEQTVDGNSRLIELVQELARGKVESLKLARQATIAWALSQTEGNVALAADMLGTSRSTVYRCARELDFQAA